MFKRILAAFLALNMIIIPCERISLVGTDTSAVLTETESAYAESEMSAAEDGEILAEDESLSASTETDSGPDGTAAEDESLSASTETDSELTGPDEDGTDSGESLEEEAETEEPETLAAAMERKYPNEKTEEAVLAWLKKTFPPTRNQTTQGVHYGNCYAFAAAALAEFYMISHGLWDKNGKVNRKVNYSELHLAYFCYHQGSNPAQGSTGDSVLFDSSLGSKRKYLNFGGNLSYAAQSLMRGNGFAEDAGKLNYLNAAEVAKAELPRSWSKSKNVAQLKSQYLINIQNNKKLVKQKIKDNGAVGITFHYRKSRLNKAEHAYYENVREYFNHVAVIVGWDDDYPASKFNHTPPGNGAWLVRNSHTSKTQLSGKSYFWLSYYDSSLSEDAYVFEMADIDKGEYYDNLYSYDSQLHDVHTVDSSKAANVYRAARDKETLKAVQFDVSGAAPGAYKISVYKNLKNPANPQSGTLISKATTTGNLPFAGKFTIPLRKSVSLKKGETFAIVLETETPLDREKDNLWKEQLWMNTAMHEGESFLCYSGNWIDISQLTWGGTLGNLCLRALTNDRNVSRVVKTVGLSVREKKLYIGDSAQIEARVFPRNAKKSAVVWKSSDTNVATVTKDGLVKAHKAGKCTITAKTANGKKAVCQITVRKMPVYRLEKNGVYRYTTDVTQVERFRKKGWKSIVAFRVPAKSKTPVYQIYYSKLKRYRYTADQSLVSIAKKAGADCRLVFYASDSKNKPVYEVMKPGKHQTYVYVKKKSSVFRLLRKCWMYRGVAFYAES